MTGRRNQPAPTRTVLGAPRPNTLRDQNAPNTLGGAGVGSAPGIIPPGAGLYSSGPCRRGASPTTPPPASWTGPGARPGGGAAPSANRTIGRSRRGGVQLPWWLLVLIAIGVFLLARNFLGVQ